MRGRTAALRGAKSLRTRGQACTSPAFLDKERPNILTQRSPHHARREVLSRSLRGDAKYDEALTGSSSDGRRSAPFPGTPTIVRRTRYSLREHNASAGCLEVRPPPLRHTRRPRQSPLRWRSRGVPLDGLISNSHEIDIERPTVERAVV